MFHPFDADVNTNACSVISCRSEPNGTKRAPGSTSGAWISSTSRAAPWRWHRSAAISSCPADHTLPVGLCGLHSR